MKKLKNFVSGFLAIALLCLASMTCFAQGMSNQPVTGPTPTFIKMCNNLFNNSTEYRALDKGQNDVTEMFVSRHASEYKSNDYNALWDAFGTELYAITWRNETEIGARGNIANRTVEDYFYVADRADDTTPQLAFEMTYVVSGDYSYDMSTLELLDYSKARISVDAFHGGSAYSYSEYNKRSDVSVSGNQVRFTASFSLRVKFKYNVYETTHDFGPYYGSVVGYIQ